MPARKCHGTRVQFPAPPLDRLCIFSQRAARGSITCFPVGVFHPFLRVRAIVRGNLLCRKMRLRCAAFCAAFRNPYSRSFESGLGRIGLSRRPELFVMFERAGSVSDGQWCPSLTLPARQKKRYTTTATCLVLLRWLRLIPDTFDHHQLTFGIWLLIHLRPKLRVPPSMGDSHACHAAAWSAARSPADKPSMSTSTRTGHSRNSAASKTQAARYDPAMVGWLWSRSCRAGWSLS